MSTASGAIEEPPAWRWILRLAIRDSKKSWGQLLLLVASVIFGTAALAALSSFKVDISKAIDENAKPLLGADLQLESRQPFSEEDEQLIASIGGETAREVVFASMAYFPKTAESRLVQINALSKEYPFYGTFETIPAAAAASFRTGAQALVDEGLLLQFSAAVGDAIRIGTSELTVAGRLVSVPGVLDARNAIAPRIYIPLEQLDKTGLIRKGSRARYRAYFRFPDSVAVDEIVKRLTPEIERRDLSLESVSDRKAGLKESLDRVYRFLDLMGFVALLVGCIGVGSAAQVYLRRKVRSIGVLRCLGASAAETVWVYVVQLACFGFLGICAGLALGLASQRALPLLLRNFLPVDVPFAPAWGALAASAGIAMCLLALFSLPPLISLRKVSPMILLRWGIEQHQRTARASVYAWIMSALGLIALAVLRAGDLRTGLAFAGSASCACIFLALLSSGSRALLHRVLPRTWPFPLRQGLANLYRPYNQTLPLMLCIGLCAFLGLLVIFLEGSILAKANQASNGSGANMVIFDVQTDQKEEMASFVRSFGLPILEQVPIVSMRLVSIRGVSIEALRKEPEPRIPEWSLTREYRSTYRDSLIPGETLQSGTFVPAVSPVAGDVRPEGGSVPVPVTLESGIAERLRVGVGDSIVFDVQGIEIATTVSGIREVDWQQVRPNFFVIFPKGVLEEAPQFNVIVTKTADAAQAAAVQKSIVQRFPNVSLIDLTLVLRTLDAVLDRLETVVRIISAFSMAATLVVLWCAIRNSRRQRAKENVLLKTLGASRSTVIFVTVAEYLFIGVLSVTSAFFLAYVTGNILSIWVFKGAMVGVGLPAIALSAVIVATVAMLGISGSWETYSLPVLDVLREETE